MICDYLALLLIIANLTIISAHVQFLPFSNTTRIRRQADCKGFQCASGECIGEDLECDGAINCKDGSDETFACRNIQCQTYLFRCAYGACIDGDFECDGKSDCKDNSDETTPKCKRSVGTEEPIFDCGANKFTCKSKQCIDEIDLCDGIPNCDDGSDETAEACYKLECPRFTYKCAYGGCVDGNARCNGKKDCVDNSDEENCGIIIPTIQPTTPSTSNKPATSQNTCVVPEAPEHGYVTVGGDKSARPGFEVVHGSVITFTCRHKYKLNPPRKEAYCIFNNWKPEIPKCEIICEPIKVNEVLNAKCYRDGSVVSCENPFNGTRAKLNCLSPYEDIALKQFPNRYCIEGTWDKNLPNCVPECGLKFVNAQKLIVGGKYAKKDHWPWAVGVYYREDKKHICGGSIINQKVVISAAHCFTDDDNRPLPPDNYLIAAGKHYRIYDHSEDIYAQYSDVNIIFMPEDYRGDEQNFRADIAVVILKTKLTLTNNVRPVCMDWGPTFEYEQLKKGAKGVVLGWGYTVEGKKPAEALKELELPYYPIQECMENLPKNFQRFATTGDKICGGFLDMNTSVCQGDSGGGLVFQRGDRYYLRGVVSVSPKSPSGSCDSNLYTLFTKVSAYDIFISEKESVHGVRT